MRTTINARGRKPERSSKPYWLFQSVGWALFASFNFGTRIYLFPDTATRVLELCRFGLALLATFPLRVACRALWLKKPRLAIGAFSCLFLTGVLAVADEWIAEFICHAIWSTPRTIGAGFVLAESSHFFVTLSCWCALYFSANAYFEAEEQARQAVASALAQREAELEVLRFQIQPAFFSIGLDRISSLVEAGNTRQASMMTSQFGGLLRSMLEEREIRFADLASELVHVGDYLKIALNQNDSPLEVDLDCASEPNQILIPRWLLIPLAEATLNTIKATGRLTIHGDDQHLVLQLLVTGSAMQVDPDFAGLSAGLQEIFGESASLTHIVLGQELEVQIRMPLVCAVNA